MTTINTRSTAITIANTMTIMSGMNVNRAHMNGGKRRIAESIVRMSGGSAPSKTAIGHGDTTILIGTNWKD